MRAIGSLRLAFPTASSPPVLPPLAQKIQAISDRGSPHFRGNLAPENFFSVPGCRDLSIDVPQSRNSAKNLCERRALPTELYPRRCGRHANRTAAHFKTAKIDLSARILIAMTDVAIVNITAPGGGLLNRRSGCGSWSWCRLRVRNNLCAPVVSLFLVDASVSQTVLKA